MDSWRILLVRFTILGRLLSSDLLEDTDLEDDVAVQQAWTELTEITREQERYAEMRAAAEKELETCRKRSAMLEDVRVAL